MRQAGRFFFVLAAFLEDGGPDLQVKGAFEIHDVHMEA